MVYAAFMVVGAMLGYLYSQFSKSHEIVDIVNDNAEDCAAVLASVYEAALREVNDIRNESLRLGWEESSALRQQCSEASVRIRVAMDQALSSRRPLDY